jgi:hypothetical protein
MAFRVEPKIVLECAADWNPADVVVIQAARNGRMYVSASCGGLRVNKLIERGLAHIESCTRECEPIKDD